MGRENGGGAAASYCDQFHVLQRRAEGEGKAEYLKGRRPCILAGKKKDLVCGAGAV